MGSEMCIRDRFSNYSKFLKGRDNHATKSICENECACNDYEEFIHAFHGHVFTRNSKFVRDLKLREVMKFGSKFRIE